MNDSTARRLAPTRRPAAVLGALSLGAVGLAVPAAADTEDTGDIGTQSVEEYVSVDVLAFNDFHGRLAQGGQSAGAAVLAGAADALRAENEDTVLVSAGDNIGASTFVSMVQQDTPTIEALNEMDLFASAVGNHEFDRGADDLTGRVSDLADFPYLVANVEGDLPNIDEYAVYESPNGVSVGFIGVVTEDVPSLVTPAGIEGLEFTDMTAAANRVAAQLSDGDAENGEADVVVVLAHEGAGGTSLEDVTGDSDFGDLVNNAENVDAIISGHTHLLYNHEVDGMQVTSASQYGEHLSRLTFDVDPDTGDLLRSTSEQLDLVVDDEPAYPANQAVADIVTAAEAAAEELGAEPLGEITADLNRARNADGSENRSGESTIGNLIADVQLWATQDLDSDIAFMNPGGIRNDIMYAGEEGSATNTDGVVTYEEAAIVQPFANTLNTMELTGAQIVDVLEEQWQPEGASRSFLRLGVSEGFEYTYDPEAPAGERIRTVTLDGEPLDLEASYTVTVNSFLASGGDNFTTFAEGTNVADSGRIDLQAFVDYLDEFSPVSPDYAQRAVGVSVPGDLVPGAEATFELSSLAFSAGEDQATELILDLAGMPLVEDIDIDTTIVDGTDEVGQATVTVILPEDIDGGTQPLRIRTDAGTDVVDLVEVEGTEPGGPGEPGTQRYGFFLNDGWDAWADHVFQYGRSTDEVLIGDWNDDGIDTITIRRGNEFHVSNAQQGGDAEEAFRYGRSSDTVLVGDWDGDGVDTLAVRRGSEYHIKNSVDGGDADVVVRYGHFEDPVVVGDWDGDGIDTLAVRRANGFHIKNTLSGGDADAVVQYGRPSDVTLVGDWDGDGHDTFAVRRGFTYHVKNSLTGGEPDLVLNYGRAGDEVYVGDWDGEGTDTLGVRRTP